MKNRKLMILTGYRHPSVKLYKPKKNKKKVGLLIGLAIPFLLTVGTNWIYLVGLKLLTKYRPLWIYN